MGESEGATKVRFRCHEAVIYGTDMQALLRAHATLCSSSPFLLVTWVNRIRDNTTITRQAPSFIGAQYPPQKRIASLTDEVKHRIACILLIPFCK